MQAANTSLEGTLDASYGRGGGGAPYRERAAATKKLH